MDNKNLQDLVLNILEPEIYKTTGQVVEEFRMEYPAQWIELEKEGEMLYGAGCGSFQQPATRISQILLSLPAEKVFSLRKNSDYYWSKR